jgi:hypothetical protein
MFNRLTKSRATVGALLVASAFFTASLVAPAMGAPGPLTLAKRALKTAKKASKTAKSASKTAKAADKRSKSASSIAASATTVANSALGKANGPGKDSGPGALRVSAPVTVPDDGSAVEQFASCPNGYLAAGGGVSVFDGNTDDPVLEGIAVTESTSTGAGWVAAVQDGSGASTVTDREMEVIVDCAKPTTVDIGPGVKKAQSRLRQR